MNERIKELIKQHSINITIDGMGYGEGNIEGLAELIVRECVKVVDETMTENQEMNFYEDRTEEDEDVQEFINSTPWAVAHSFEEFLEQVQGCCGEYYYVMRDGVWYAGCVYDTEGLVKNGLVALKDAIAAINETVAE